jgi:hypothetical protein
MSGPGSTRRWEWGGEAKEQKTELEIDPPASRPGIVLLDEIGMRIAKMSPYNLAKKGRSRLFNLELQL